MRPQPDGPQPTPEVRAFLDLLSSSFPALGTDILDAAEARRLLEGQRAARPGRPLPRVQDMTAAWTDSRGGPRTVAVRGYWPSRRPDAPAVVFLHGGGFVLCGLDSHDALCRDLAARTGAVVLSVDYRRAPEHRFPAAAEDAYGALCWVREQAGRLGCDPSRISVAGDSAGGNLAAAVALMSRDRNGPALRSQVLLYPMLDPAQDSASYRRYADGFFLTAAHLAWYWDCYLPRERPATAPEYLAPPAAATLTGLPPALVVLAGCDPLHDEGLAYAARLELAGVAVTALDFPGLFHGFFGFSEQLAAVAEAVDTVMEALPGVLGSTPVVDQPSR